MQTETATDTAVIFFDGVCNLCNASVNFIIDRDSKRYFRFAALQSEAGQRFLNQHGLNATDFDSIVLYEDGQIYQKSTAALRIARKLDFLYPVLYTYIVIPVKIRDFFYNLIATNRYKWFGRRNECRIPTPELKSRFLD